MVYKEFSRKIKLNSVLGIENNCFVNFLLSLKKNGYFELDQSEYQQPKIVFYHKGINLFSFYFDSKGRIIHVKNKFIYNIIKFNYYEADKANTVRNKTMEKEKEYELNEFIFNYIRYYLIESRENVNNNLVNT